MSYPGGAAGGGYPPYPGGQMPPGFQPGQINPQMSYMMMASQGQMPPQQMPLDDTTAKIRITTGNQGPDCGTNAQVTLSIYGEKGSTGSIKLGDPNGGYFEPGGTSEFGLKIPKEIGKPYKIRLSHDNSGKKADWYVEKVILERQDFSLTFPLNAWLSNKKGNKVIVQEAPSIESGLANIKYEVVTKTGKERNAGTDANVWIRVFGERGDTGKRYLTGNVYLGRRLDKFRKGKSDPFSLVAVNLGKLSHVIIGHDGKKKSDDWLVEHVVVKTPSGGPMFWFPCNDWIGVESVKERKLDCAGMRNIPDDSDED